MNSSEDPIMGQGYLFLAHYMGVEVIDAGEGTLVVTRTEVGVL